MSFFSDFDTRLLDVGFVNAVLRLTLTECRKFECFYNLAYA